MEQIRVKMRTQGTFDTCFMPCIHTEWAILGDNVRDASRRLLYYYIFIQKP